MDRSKRPREIREYIYWAIFIFVAVFMSNIVLGAINATVNEQTSFIQANAIAKKRHVETAKISTSYGEIVIRFNRAAPMAVNNFSQLALSGFYDGTKIHRVVKELLIQGGDPLSREDDRELYGTGGPDYVFENETTGLPMKRGVVAMANRGKPKTNGSQFFILTADKAPDLEGKYTIFGEVIEGMDVVDAINQVPTDEKNIPIDPVVIQEVNCE